jgi:hypothetical protein
MEDIANILTVGILIGVGLAFVPIVIGVAVGGILKILNKM